MTIRVTLNKVLVQRDVSLTELGEQVGITLANLSILKTGKARAVRFTTLDALCRVLQCQPADLLVFESDECDSDKLLRSGREDQSAVQPSNIVRSVENER